MRYSTDIIVYVRSDLSSLITCVHSIIRSTKPESFYLWFSCSHPNNATRQFIEEICKEYSNIDYLSDYLKFAAEPAERVPYIMVLSNPVIVAEGWLERMCDVLESYASIGSVCPVLSSDQAFNIPLPPGMNYRSMNEYLGSITRYLIQSDGHVSKPCVMYRRDSMGAIGLAELDKEMIEQYGTAHGLEQTIASDVFVFDGMSPSQNSLKLDTRGMVKHSVYRRKASCVSLLEPLSIVRTDVFLSQYLGLGDESRWAPMYWLRENYRSVRNNWREHGLRRAALTFLINFQTVLSCRTLVYRKEKECVEAANSNRLRVTYLLDRVTIAGGVLSVIQLVNELILLGVDAKIVCLYQYPETFRWTCYSSIIVFRDYSEMNDHFPESDIIVATHWTTVNPVDGLLKRYPRSIGAYFVQDYEPWFFDEKDSASRQKVKDTYSKIESKIVKSRWLQDLIEIDGFSSKRIALGMDLGVFYPREVKSRAVVRVLAMARPGTPRRGFNTLCHALQKLISRKGDIEITLFGEDLSGYDLPFEHKSLGVISDRNALAELYSASDIYVDTSDFQGFGRPALEAMACGATCVLTNVGGVTEYARHRENCLTVRPGDFDGVAKAIHELISDSGLRAYLSQQAVETTRSFCHKREAVETAAYFRSLCDS